MFLGFAAMIWLGPAIGIFCDWESAVELLQNLGANAICYDQMVDYWLRMTSGAFTFLGIWYVILMLSPDKYDASIPYFGLLMIVESVILLIHGIRLSLPSLPFCADVTGCFISGAGILISSFIQKSMRSDFE